LYAGEASLNLTGQQPDPNQRGTRFSNAEAAGGNQPRQQEEGQRQAIAFSAAAQLRKKWRARMPDHRQAARHQTSEPTYGLSLVLRRSREVHRVDFTHRRIVGLLERVRCELHRSVIALRARLARQRNGKG
jgi:hypothetical protein